MEKKIEVGDTLAVLIFLVVAIVGLGFLIYFYEENKQECKLAAIEKNYAAVEAIAICGGLK